MSTISYTRQGSGEPIVLLHGIGHHRRVWDEVASRLAQRFEVITLDLPGHGTSPAPRAPHSYAISSHTDQFEELFGELGIDRPHVVGNSLGGLMALDLAARGSVRSATGLSPAGFFAPYGLAWIGPVLLALKVLSLAPTFVLRRVAALRLGRRVFMSPLYVSPERLTPEAFLADALNLRRSRGFDVHVLRGARFKLRYAGTPAVPTTIAWAERDRVLLRSQAKRARRELPNAHHVTLPACGHVSMHDDPDLVVRVIVDTVERAATTPRPVADLAS